MSKTSKGINSEYIFLKNIKIKIRHSLVTLKNEMENSVLDIPNIFVKYSAVDPDPDRHGFLPVGSRSRGIKMSRKK